MAPARRFFALLSLPLAWLACSSGGASSGAPATATGADAAPGPSAAPGASAAPSPSPSSPPAVMPVDGGDGAPPLDAAPPDPCPTLPIPTTCFNRNVVYREWNATAQGDGSYFASQAPYRLGFNRTQGNIWIVKFRVDENTYLGRLSAYGDASGGMVWISDKPCDETFAIDNKLVIWGNHGGGTLHFDVTRNASDASRLRTDPAYAAHKNTPQLQGGHCYYAAFENTDTFPTSIDSSLWSSPDTCGESNGGTSCYYLAFDMFHYLTDPISGNRMGGSVIAGLTQ